MPVSISPGVSNYSSASNSSALGVSALIVFSPASLFLAGEQGAWYDPSDITTLFQDSAGSIPVTSLGQPVGMMLDKSKGLVLGPEKSSDPEINNPARWTFSASVVISGGKATFISSSSGNSLRQPDVATPGKWHYVEVIVESISSGSIRYLIATGQTVITLVVGINRFMQYYTPGNTAYGGVFAVGTTNAAITRISVKEIPGNHAFQETTTKRPPYQQDSFGRYYLAFDGVDDALVTKSIDFTATETMTVFAGVRKLSNSATGMLLETSTESGVNAGTFQIRAPNGAATNYLLGVRGALAEATVTISPYSAPISTVLTLSANLLSSIFIQANGVKTNISNGTGGGNYGNYPLFIGQRNQSSLAFNGNIYSLIIRGVQSSSTQIASTEKYVNSKTGAY